MHLEPYTTRKRDLVRRGLGNRPTEYYGNMDVIIQICVYDIETSPERLEGQDSIDGKNKRGDPETFEE